MKKTIQEGTDVLSTKLEALFDVIDSWEDKEVRKKDVTYGYLSDSLIVRKWVVSPNMKYGMTNLKTVLLADVLEVHKDKWESNISYETILKHMKGEKITDYKFIYGILEKCFQKEANRDAFLTGSRVLQGKKDLKEIVGKCEEWIPYILLDQLRENAWELLDKYYFVCGKKFCKKCENKKLLYYRFTQVVVLFEICFIEYVQEPIRAMIEQSNEIMAEMMKELQNFHEDVGKLSDEAEKLNISNAGEYKMQLAQELVQDMAKLNDISEAPLQQLTKNFEMLTIFKLLEAEFTRELCALFHLLLVFETVNVYDDMQKKVQIGLNLEVEFLAFYDKNFKSFGRTNKNKNVYYKHVNKYLEELLEEYTGRSFDVKKCVIDFLEELSVRNKGKETKMFFSYMGRLAEPIYKKLGGDYLA